MTAGWSRLRIFNPSGNLLEEIDYPTTRSWILNNAQTTQLGRCQFTVNVYDAFAGGFNPKLTQANFQYGNLLLCEHKPSVNEDGTTNGKLPDWVGVIVPPQTWEYGKVTITAVSAEQLLAYRSIGGSSASNHYSGGPPGGAFAWALSLANQNVTFFGSGVPIQPGSIDYGGKGVERYFKLDALTEIRGIATASGFDWDVTPQVSAGNQLQLFGNWYPKKGIDAGLVLSNLNLQSVSPLYTEQGQFYNFVIGYSSSTSPANRVFARSINQAGINANGPMGTVVVFQNTEGIAQEALQAMTDAYLAGISGPLRTFAPTLLDKDNDFSFAVTGNTMLVQNDTVGFFNGGIGVNGSVRITAVEYSELTNLCKMVVVLQ